MTRTRRAFLTMWSLTAVGIAIMVVAKVIPVSSMIRLPEQIVGVIEPQPIAITILSSVTKQKWMEAAIARFEASKVRTASGKSIAVTATGVLSGDSMERILAGTAKPDAWSPGEGSWVAQFNDSWKRAHNAPAMSKTCEPTIYTPSGVAMWRPMAEALGWPAKKIGWATIMALAADAQGWGSYGHPEWGRLKLGYTHPQYSSAGLLFLTSVIYGMTGQTKALKAEQVYDPKIERALAAMAEHTSKYGMVTTNLLDMMAKQGPDYLHVVSAFEEGVVRFNLERGRELRFPLVFLFPSEGTFWSDHPYCILDGADWVTPEQAEAAGLFLDFLQGKDQQILATEYLLRPLDSAIPAGKSLTVENGTDPQPRPENVPPFEVPDAATATAIIDQFLTTKRKATIMLVLDISGSMNGEPIRAATEATAAFLKRLDPRDEVGLMIFNDSVSVVSEIEPSATISEELSRRVLQLVSGGGTNLNGAVCRAVRKMQEDKDKRGRYAANRLYGIVILSDGADTAGEVSEARMFQTCLPATVEASDTKIFTIAFGDGANLDALNRLSQVTGGVMFKADAKTIDQAYLKISAEQ